MIPALHGDVMFTKGRVRAGDLLGPGPASPGFASFFHIPSTFPSPAKQELQDITAAGTARVPCQGTNITVALKPKMPTGCGGVNRGAKQPLPSSPWLREDGALGLIPTRSFGIQEDISTPHTAWDNQLGFYHVISF